MALRTLLRQFAFRIGFEVDDDDLKQLEGDVENLGESWDQFGREARGQLLAVGAALAAFSVGVQQAVAGTVAQGDAAMQLATALGTTVQAAQEYAAVVERFGADTFDVADAFATLADRSRDAQDGMQSFIDDFRLVGIEVDDLRGKSPQQLFNLFADALASVEDPGDRIAAVVRVLGDDLGRKLAPLLFRGADGIRALREEAVALGAVLDEDAVAQTVEFRTNLTRLRQVAIGLRNTFSVTLLPILNETAEALLGWVNANRELLRQDIARFGRQVAGVIRRIRDLVTEVDGVVRSRLGGWPRVIGAIGAAIAAIGIARLTAALVPLAVNLARVGGSLYTVAAGATSAASSGGVLAGVVSALGALFSPAGAVIAVIAAALAILAAKFVAVGLAIEDLSVFLRGGDSAFGRLLDSMRESGPIMSAVADLLEEFVRLTGDLIGLLADAATLIGVGWSRAIEQLTNQLTALGRVLTSIVDLVLSLFGTDIAGVLIDPFTELLRSQRRAVSGTRTILGAGINEQRALQAAGVTVGLRSGAEPITPALNRTANAINNVTVQVDARGQSAAGLIGAEVGFNVDQALRQLQAATLGGI